MIDTRYYLLIVIPVLFLHSEGYPETRQLEINVGEVFFLSCETYFQNRSVKWRREHNQSLDEGISVMNQSLWFLPVQESHSGQYSCFFRTFHGLVEKIFSVSVAKRKCPQQTPLTDQKFLFMGIPQFLNCNTNHMWKIRQLDSISNVTWSLMKDCSPLSWHDNSGIFRFIRVSESDGGVYTCLMNFTHKETVYTAAYTMDVIIADLGCSLKTNKKTTPACGEANSPIGPVPQKPRVVKPRKETLSVKLGLSYELNCKVFVGTDKLDPVEYTHPYWLIGTSHTEHYPHIVTNSNCVLENDSWYCHCNLSILEVQPEFLNVPFICIGMNSVGFDNGTVTLQPASQRAMYCGVLLFIAYTLVALGLLVFHWFKVDLVLAYRNLIPSVKKQSDGKLYDAYVCYIHGNDQSTSSASSFALHVLPEVLEEQLGYKLFISGRDDLPGAAIHDVIAETVGKSRRLIVVLPSLHIQETPSEPLIVKDIVASDSHLPENSTLNWNLYEWQVGLHDALVKEKLQVILIQLETAMDEALLPESLCYVKHTQGMLKWKQSYATKSKAKFWRQLQYRMPPVPMTRMAAMV